jgi:uncharacterized membrane protein (UPF0136 family)
MSHAAMLFFAYAVLLIGGGLMGFIKAKSSASLISGTVTGLLSLGVAFLIPSSHHTALICGAILSFVVSMIFILRFFRTKKAMPAIPMIIVSDLVAVASIMLLVRK